jgi:hypothetical protein
VRTCPQGILSSTKLNLVSPDAPLASQVAPEGVLRRLSFASCFLQAYIRNFGEEVVRGQPAFVLSMLLRWLAPALRETAGVSSWQVRDFRFIGWC